MDCNQVLFSLEKGRWWRQPDSSLPMPVRRSPRWSWMLHSGGHWEDKGQWAYIEAREVQTGYKEKCFYHCNSQAVEQLAQRCRAVSLLGGFKVRQDKAMSSLIESQSSSCFEQEIAWETSWSPLCFELSYDLTLWRKFVSDITSMLQVMARNSHLPNNFISSLHIWDLSFLIKGM